jgi:Flp pilus assembly protein TadG
VIGCRPVRRPRTRARRRDERGYVAVFTALLFAALFSGLAATAVDTANWYLEAQKVQNAADAAALAGVVYMPQDLASATTTAQDAAARNGYLTSNPNVTISAARGSSSSQLKVTVTSRIHNTFGAMFGVPWTTISRSATADFTGPAPMGSPCNIFGNEPTGGAGASAATPSGSALGAAPFASCTSNPQFWATVEGPETGKVQGDRFSTVACEDVGVTLCDAGKHNTEYDGETTKGYQGYFYVVKVGPAAVGKPIQLQLFDPAFVSTGQQCASLSSSISSTTPYNDYTSTDAPTRYSPASATASPVSLCPGDNFPGTGSGASSKHPMITSFVLRDQTDTQDPMKAAVTTSAGQPCIKQYGAYLTPPSDSALKKNQGGGSNLSSSYNQQLAKVFHNWTDFCTFTPTRQGDYYLQVRTNVALGGTPEANTNSLPSLVYSGNMAAAASAGNTTAGEGANSFSIRAVVPGYEKSVAVSGYDRMTIFENGSSSTAQFHLIRVLPGAKGYSISFSFFDVGDATGGGSGSIQVLPPTDIKNSGVTTPFPTACTAEGAGAGSGTTLTNCTAAISNAQNNGKLETMTIPIPSDYDCDYLQNNGCWYQVKVVFPAGITVKDTTTWTAGVISDPVRLIE